MSENLNQDINIPEIKVGSFEIYGLKAWYSASAWHIFFLPAKVGAENPPEIDFNDISVWVDGEKREISSFTKHMVANDYPSYLLNVEAPKVDEYVQLIRVRVDSPKKGFGEAWFIHY